MTTTERAVRDVEQQPADQTSDEFIHYDHIGHGSTPAAWTLCITIMIAAAAAAVGIILTEWVLVWIGAALVPVAIILGVVLKQMGYGVELDAKAVVEQGDDPRGHQGPALPDHGAGSEKRDPQSPTSPARR